MDGVLVSSDEEDWQLELSQRPPGQIHFEEVGSGSMVELSQRLIEHIQFEEVGSGSMAAADAWLEHTPEGSGKSDLVGTCSVAAWHSELSVVSS